MSHDQKDENAGNANFPNEPSLLSLINQAFNQNKDKQTKPLTKKNAREMILNKINSMPGNHISEKIKNYRNIIIYFDFIFFKFNVYPIKYLSSNIDSYLIEFISGDFTIQINDDFYIFNYGTAGKSTHNTPIYPVDNDEYKK